MVMADTHRLPSSFVLVTGVTYVGSFALPVSSEFYGVHAFLYALFYCFIPSLNGLPWFANVALWVGVVYLTRDRWHEARRAGLIAIALGLTVLPICWNKDNPEVGYYVWLASMAILTVGAITGEAVERHVSAERKRFVREWRDRHGNVAVRR